MITAPAGYGKTVLLEEALAPLPGIPAWVRCTPRERDPGHLVASLLAAVPRALPGASVSVSEALERAQSTVQPAATLEALLSELDLLLVDPIIIVVDDADNLADAPAACAVLGQLLRHPSGGCRVAVLTRQPLGLPLGKPRAAGRVVELQESDLVFTARECAEYVEEIREGPCPDLLLDELLAATEGWPLGVVMLALASGSNPAAGDSQTPLRSPEQLKAYLHEEVLAVLDPTTRRALLASAVPHHLSPTIATALGLPDYVLPALVNQGLFLRPVEGNSEIFGYHPLFREILLEQLTAAVPGPELRGLHRRVAPVLAENGSVVEAIGHWIAAREWSSAIAAMGGQCRTLAATSPGLVRSWLAQLPVDHRAAPVVAMLRGHLAWAGGEYSTAIERLQAALAGDGLAGEPASAWWCRFLLIDCLNMSGRHEEAVGIADGFHQDSARQAGVIAAATGLYAAHGLAALGRVREAEEMAKVARRLPEQALVAPIDAVLQAYIDLPSGRLDLALERAMTAYRGVEESDPLLLRFNVMAAIAIVLGEQGRIEEALDWWRRQRREAVAALLHARTSVVQGMEAMLAAQLGQLAAAEAQLASYEPTDTWADLASHVARCVVAAGRADRGAALAHCRAAQAVAEVAPPLFRYWTAMALVPPTMRVGAAELAANLVADAARLVEETFPGEDGCYVRARTLALGAWLDAERGDIERSRDKILRSLRQAGDAVPHLLRLEWQRVRPLVVSALTDGALDPPTVVGWLWEAFPDGRALADLVEHPRPEVRRASFQPALASGNPWATAIVVAACEEDVPTVAAAARGALERMPAAPIPRVFDTLGGFGVTKGSWKIDERAWTRPVDARLVRFLLVRDQEPVAEDLVLETFWPDLEPDRARRSLHVAASRVRGVLDHPGDGPSILDAHRGSYRLCLHETDVVDWQEFDRAATIALAKEIPDRRVFERAQSLWGGEPLPRERYSDWAAAWRARLIDRYIEVLSGLVDAYHREGSPLRAIAAAREMVELDPLDEAAHRTLMTAMARAGRRGQALRQFLVCRRLLVDDLGVEPAEATASLHSRILAGGDV